MKRGYLQSIYFTGILVTSSIFLMSYFLFDKRFITLPMKQESHDRFVHSISGPVAGSRFLPQNTSRLQVMGNSTIKFKNGSAPVDCDLDILQTCHAARTNFCQQGTWYNIAEGYPYAKFEPGFCSFSAPGTADMSLKRYLANCGHRKLLVLGDSQGQRYHQALVNVFQQAGYECQLRKWENEGFTPGSEYYTQNTSIPPEAIVAGKRTCRSCRSALYRCLSAGQQVDVEYLAMMTTANNSILPNKTFCAYHHSPVCSAISHQEFIFKVYLENTAPDLILLFSTFGHDYGKSFQEVTQAIQHLLDVLETMLPPQYTAIWFTTSPFLERKMRARDKTWRFENGYDINGKIQAHNRILYSLIKGQVETSRQSKTFGFFDLFSMAKGVQDRWGTDHVHMQSQWYRYIIRYLLHMLAKQATRTM